jgi:hypothetical protein
MPHMPYAFQDHLPQTRISIQLCCPTLYYMNSDLACSVQQGVGWGWPLERWSTQNCGLLELLSQELHISVPADKQMQARWSKSSIGIPTYWIWTLFQCCRIQQNMNKDWELYQSSRLDLPIYSHIYQSGIGQSIIC